MKPRILVTRPEPGAARTAKRLEAAGFEPVALPLTRIERLEFEPPGGDFDGLVVTSAQALIGGDFSRFASLPVIAVGEMTAKTALDAGFSTVTTTTGSAESVAERAISTLTCEGRLLYVCGSVRRPELQNLLTEAGFLVQAVETYSAAPIKYALNHVESILGPEKIEAVLLMSAVAAALFREPAALPQLRGALMICFSERIAEVAQEFGNPTAVTDDATEESLMDLLRSRFPGSS